MTLDELNELSARLYNDGKFAEALPIAEQALRAAEENFGVGDPKTANSFNWLASICRRLGDHKKAESFLKRALEIAEQVLGPDHIDTGPRLHNLAQLYLEDTREFEKAEALLQRALKIAQKQVGENHSDTAYYLGALADTYRKKGDLSRAAPTFRQALQIQEKLPAEEYLYTATLTNFAMLFYDQGDYAKAEPLFEQVWQIRQRSFGREHAETLTSLNWVAAVHQKKGDLAQAERLLQEAVQICENIHGSDHPQTAASVGRLAWFYRDIGDLGRAEPLYERALSIQQRTLGPDHPETADTLKRLAELHQRLGDFGRSEGFSLRALNIDEKILGKEHPITATTLHNLGLVYMEMGEAEKAEVFLRRALEIREKALGLDHPDTAQTLNQLGTAYEWKGEYDTAQPLLQRALNINETILGPNHAETAYSLTGLARLYQSRAQHTHAEPLYQRALGIYETAIGQNDPNLASCLYEFGIFYEEIGDFSKAAAFHQRAITIWENSLGPAHHHTGLGLICLARVYENLGDYAKAEPLIRRVLNLQEKAFGVDHPNASLCLNDLAILYFRMGDYSEAERLLLRALATDEKTLASEHPRIGTGLNNLGEVYQSMGNFDKAEAILQRALNIREKASGPEHPETAKIVNNLATLYDAMGKSEKALPFHQRALRIYEKALGPNHPDTAMSLNNLAKCNELLGDYVKAEPFLLRAVNIWEKTYGPKHPATATAYSNVAWLWLKCGKASQALEMARKTQAADAVTLANVLSFTSESQRLDYLATLDPYSLPVALESPPDIALAVLWHKGVVLDSLLEDRLLAQTSGRPEYRALVDELRSARQRLAQVLFEEPKDFGADGREKREVERTKLSKEVERLEGALARAVTGLGRARRALSVTVEQMQGALPPDSALIEFIRYHHLGLAASKPQRLAQRMVSWMGQLFGSQPPGSRTEWRYGAVVLVPAGETQWAALSDAKSLDEKISAYQAVVRGGSPSDSPKSEAQNLESAVTAKTKSESINQKSEILSPLLRGLYQNLWATIETVLPAGTKTVILSPDGALNFLSFATLLTPEDQFLSQKYSIRYVTSGRDLLRETLSSTGGSLSIYSDPDFSGEGRGEAGNSEPPGGPLGEMERRDFRALSLPPLPGTARESEALSAKAKAWHWPTDIRTGAEATKANLQSLRSPRILHLATHGFFLPEDENVERASVRAWEHRGIGGLRPKFGLSGLGPSGLMEAQVFPGPVGPRFLKNPMHQSGLALAGAQATLDAWNRGETPASDNDGIVTAADVGTLDLQGTWLVTLSACDTGMGELRSGEGVLGLRRAFIQAGAENLLMTLWPIADEETAHFMVEFYDAAHRSGDAPRALAEVQRDWLVRLRRERGLQAAVSLAGPFILSSLGLISKPA